MSRLFSLACLGPEKPRFQPIPIAYSLAMTNMDGQTEAFSIWRVGATPKPFISAKKLNPASGMPSSTEHFWKMWSTMKNQESSIFPMQVKQKTPVFAIPCTISMLLSLPKGNRALPVTPRQFSSCPAMPMASFHQSHALHRSRLCTISSAAIQPRWRGPNGVLPNQPPHFPLVLRDLF